MDNSLVLEEDCMQLDYSSDSFMVYSKEEYVPTGCSDTLGNYLNHVWRAKNCNAEEVVEYVGIPGVVVLNDSAGDADIKQALRSRDTTVEYVVNNYDVFKGYCAYNDRYGTHTVYSFNLPVYTYNDGESLNELVNRDEVYEGVVLANATAIESLSTEAIGTVEYSNGYAIRRVRGTLYMIKYDPKQYQTSKNRITNKFIDETKHEYASKASVNLGSIRPKFSDVLMKAVVSRIDKEIAAKYPSFKGYISARSKGLRLEHSKSLKDIRPLFPNLKAKNLHNIMAELILSKGGEGLPLIESLIDVLVICADLLHYEKKGCECYAIKDDKRVFKPGPAKDDKVIKLKISELREYNVNTIYYYSESRYVLRELVKLIDILRKRKTETIKMSRKVYKNTSGYAYMLTEVLKGKCNPIEETVKEFEKVIRKPKKLKV